MAINGHAEDLDYEVNIVEEVVDQIDSENVITRNRYGALVLNSKSTMFIDIDYVRASFWEGIFGMRGLPRNKDRIRRHIRKCITKVGQDDLVFRVYETFKGFRVMVLGRSFDPRSEESKQLMDLFKADWLYKSLCVRQNCYRARLTPKPYRMKHRAYKLPFPERTEEEERAQKKWIESYDSRLQKYAVCRLDKEYGETTLDRVVRYHDRIANVKYENRPLA